MLKPIAISGDESFPVFLPTQLCNLLFDEGWKYIFALNSLGSDRTVPVLWQTKYDLVGNTELLKHKPTIYYF